MKTTKKTNDLTVKQFKLALARNGMELTQDGNLDVISVFGFELTGKTRRAKLANAIAKLAEYNEAEEARTERETAAHAAQIAAAEDGTGPAKAQALREAAEANTLHYNKGIGTGAVHESIVDQAVREMLPAQDRQHAVDSDGAAKTRTCPQCGGPIPPRYRVCDTCLAKNRAAKSAAPSTQKAS